jgi:hypothetical protein
MQLFKRTLMHRRLGAREEQLSRMRGEQVEIPPLVAVLALAAVPAQGAELLQVKALEQAADQQLAATLPQEAAQLPEAILQPVARAAGLGGRGAGQLSCQTLAPMS